MSILTDKVRARTLGLTLAAACVAALPVQAQQTKPPAHPASKQENIGVVSGLAIGAAIGGPIGAVIGGAAGGVLGDHYHKQKVKNAALAGDLSRSESERTALAKNVADLNGSLAKSQERAEQLDRAVSQTDQLETDVGFRTNDASIDTKSMSPLLKIGALAASMPDVKVRVAGYADPRGSTKYNEELSQRRAEAVAAVLAQAGLSSEQLIVEAHGKSASTSAEGDLDSYALDRRVTVRIERSGGAAVAQVSGRAHDAPARDGLADGAAEAGLAQVGPSGLTRDGLVDDKLAHAGP
jgi:outer membrane protein OmpA-like peptidoglycan-associated protein